MNKIVITGGAGFIGSHIVDFFVNHYPHSKVFVLDKMTYAADYRFLMQHSENANFRLIVGDITDYDVCKKMLEDTDLLVHAAAESHVGNSFSNSIEFTKTNTIGTHCLMEAARVLDVKKIIHISTDEVYGEVLAGSVDENGAFAPTNPYSASKAAAEMVVRGYSKSFNLPVVIVRANNMYGERQFPEKLIPRAIFTLNKGEKIPIHGSGLNQRTFLSVYDFCDAIDLLVKRGVAGEAYNVGTEEEYRNIDVARILCNLFKLDESLHIVHVPDRPFNDGRYSVNYQKITKLGWAKKRTLVEELPGIIKWYRQRSTNYFDFN
jgi:dTDP-glucose 4,6-dehydratase